MVSTGFEKWISSFSPEGPSSIDLDELAWNLCAEGRPSRQGTDLFESLNKTSFTPSSDTVSWKGVSVKWFLQVFMQSPEANTFVEFGCPMWFVRNHCIQQILPRLPYGDSCCLVDCVEAIESPEPLVAKATVFVSYTGNYKLEEFAELVKDLESHCMWSDVFCVDQVAWKRQDNDFKDSFMYRLKENIENIGFTVLLLNKWDHLMGALGMIWVLWEIFATVNASARLEVLLSESEHERFLADGLGSQSGSHAIFNSLSDIDARKAQARYEEDRTRILQIMDSVEGVSRVNSQVTERMREWLLDTGASVFGEALNVMNIEEDGEEAVVDACKMTHNMAHLYRDMGNFTKAERLERKVVQGFRECLGEDHLETLNALNALAGILRMQRNDLNEAESLYREVFEKRSRRLGNANLDTLTSANNLGNLLTDQLKFDEAKDVYQSAEQQLQPFDDNEDIAVFDLRISLKSNLGTVHSEMGELTRASEIVTEVLNLCNSKLGRRHPRTQRAVGNLATVKHRLEDYEVSERLFRECLKVQGEMFGDSSPQTLQIVHNLAKVLLDIHKLEEAENLFRRAVDDRRTLLGNDNSDTLKSVAGLAEALSEQNKMLEAEPFYREAFQLRSRVLGDDHPETLASTMNLALFLIKMGEVGEAGPLCEKAYDRYREIYGPNNDLTQKASLVLSLTRQPNEGCL